MAGSSLAEPVLFRDVTDGDVTFDPAWKALFGGGPVAASGHLFGCALLGCPGGCSTGVKGAVKNPGFERLHPRNDDGTFGRGGSHPAVKAVKAARKAVAPRAPKATPTDGVAAFNAAKNGSGSIEELRAKLSGLTAKQLDEVAGKLDLDLRGRRTKQQKIDGIVQPAEFVQNANAIMRAPGAYDNTPEPDLPPTPKAAPAVKLTAPQKKLLKELAAPGSELRFRPRQPGQEYGSWYFTPAGENKPRTVPRAMAEKLVEAGLLVQTTPSQRHEPRKFDLSGKGRSALGIPEPALDFGSARERRDLTNDTQLAQRLVEQMENDPTVKVKWGQFDALDGGDAMFTAVAKEQGFAQPMQTVNAAEFTRMLKRGEIESVLYRGTSGGRGGKTANDVMNQLRTGELFGGKGTFGNGTYLATSRVHANTYADKTPGSLGKFGLKADAKVIEWADLLKEHQEWFDRHFGKDTDYSTYGKSYLYQAFGDPGVWAMARGYDAIFVRAGEEPGFGSPAQGDQYTVVNRSALIAQVS